MSWYFYSCTGKSQWVPHLSEDLEEIIRTQDPEFTTILETNCAMKSKEDRPQDLAYRGPMYFDWDGADEIQDVLDSVKRFMGRLETAGFPLDQAYWYLTGGKGVHCVIPAACFMDEKSLKNLKAQGNRLLPSIYRMLASSETLVSNHLDLSIYSGGRGRMWRTPNRARTRADGRTTYKVAIRAEDLKRLDEAAYWAWCSEPRPAITPAVPTRCADLATEFSMACNKVDRAFKMKAANKAKEVVFEGWTTIPPTIADAFEGKGIAQSLDLNAIKLQLCIAATAVGFSRLSDEDRFIEAVRGFIQSRVGREGAAHRTAGSIEEALRNCFRSVAETPYYRYTSSGMASILETNLRQNPDLSGKHTAETNNEEAIEQRNQAMAGDYHTDTGGTVKFERKGDGVTQISTYAWEAGSIMKILDKSGRITAYSVIPLVHEQRMPRAILPLTTLLDSKKLAFHVAEYGGNVELSGTGASTKVRTSWENYAKGISNLQEAELAEAVQLEGMYIQHRVPKDQTGAEEFGEGAQDPDNYDTLLSIHWIEPNRVVSSTYNFGPTPLGAALPSPQYYDPSNPDGRYGVDLASAGTTLANPRVPAKEVINAMLELNGNFFSLASLLGWFTACLIKHPLYTLGKITTFPILQVYGEAGCGKTTTMNLLLKLFTWREEFRVTAAGPGLTEAAYRMMATGTASIPMVIDEVKSQNLGRSNWLQLFHQLLQNSYTIGGIVRKAGGRGADSHHNSLVDDPMYAPVAFMGETLETSQVSLMERIVPAGFHKADKNGRADHATYLQHHSRVVSIVGWTLVTEVMEGSMNDLVALYEASKMDATRTLFVEGNDRITTNGAMILAGFRFFANTVEKYFPGVFSAKLESLESALLDPTKWMRDTPSEVVRLLNFLSQASHDPEFSRTRAFKDIHYWFEPGESAHGTVNYLCIPCDAVYILYRERMKAIGEEPVFSSAQEMFVALRNSVLVVDSFNHPDRGNNCVKLDPHQLELSQVRPFRPH